MLQKFLTNLNSEDANAVETLISGLLAIDESFASIQNINDVAEDERVNILTKLFVKQNLTVQHIKQFILLFEIATTALDKNLSNEYVTLNNALIGSLAFNNILQKVEPDKKEQFSRFIEIVSEKERENLKINDPELVAFIRIWKEEVEKLANPYNCRTLYLIKKSPIAKAKTDKFLDQFISFDFTKVKPKIAKEAITELKTMQPYIIAKQQFSIAQLQLQDEISSNKHPEQLKKSSQAVLDAVNAEHDKDNSGVHVQQLTEVLKQTKSVLTNPQSQTIKKYAKLTKEVSGNPSITKQLTAGMLFFLGSVLILTGVLALGGIIAIEKGMNDLQKKGVAGAVDNMAKTAIQQKTNDTILRLNSNERKLYFEAKTSRH